MHLQPRPATYGETGHLWRQVDHTLWTTPPFSFADCGPTGVHVLHTQGYSAIYDVESVPRRAIFSPHETSPEPTSLHPHITPLSLRMGFSPRVRDARRSRASSCDPLRPSHTPGRLGVRACKISHIPPPLAFEAVTVGDGCVCDAVWRRSQPDGCDD